MFSPGWTGAPGSCGASSACRETATCCPAPRPLQRRSSQSEPHRSRPQPITARGWKHCSTVHFFKFFIYIYIYTQTDSDRQCEGVWERHCVREWVFLLTVITVYCYVGSHLIRVLWQCNAPLQSWLRPLSSSPERDGRVDIELWTLKPGLSSWFILLVYPPV